MMACDTTAGRSMTIRPPIVLAWARRTWPHSQALKAMASCASSVYCQNGGTCSGLVSGGRCASHGVWGRKTTSSLLSKEPFLSGNEPGKTAWLAIFGSLLLYEDLRPGGEAKVPASMVQCSGLDDNNARCKNCPPICETAVYMN